MTYYNTYPIVGYNTVYQYQNLNASQIGQILAVAGPLVIKYLVPFVKELVSSLGSSGNQAPLILPPYYGYIQPRYNNINRFRHFRHF